MRGNAQKLDASLKTLNDQISHNWRLLKNYARMEKWSSLQHFYTMQLLGTTTIYSTMDSQDLKKLFVLQCIGKVC